MTFAPSVAIAGALSGESARSVNFRSEFVTVAVLLDGTGSVTGVPSWLIELTRTSTVAVTVVVPVTGQSAARVGCGFGIGTVAAMVRVTLALTAMGAVFTTQGNGIPFVTGTQTPVTAPIVMGAL